MKVKITDCSNKECIGFIGYLIDKITFDKMVDPFSWIELIKHIDPHQVMIAGEDKSFISDKNGFITYQICE